MFRLLTCILSEIECLTGWHFWTAERVCRADRFISKIYFPLGPYSTMHGSSLRMKTMVMFSDASMQHLFHFDGGDVATHVAATRPLLEWQL